MTVTVKGVAADAAQLKVIDGALGMAHGLGAVRRVMIAVVMCMTQESVCRSIDFGDNAGPDSRGPFQQRDPWGPLSVRMDPAGSCKLFLMGGETGEAGWVQHFGSVHNAPADLGDAITRVQVSVGGYAQWEPESTRTVDWWLTTLPSRHYERYMAGGERKAAERYDFWRDQQTAKKHPHRAWMLMRKRQCKLYARRIELAVTWDVKHHRKDAWSVKNRRFRHTQLMVRARGEKTQQT